MAASAVAVLIARRSSAAPRRGPSLSTSSRRDGPGTYSLTMYGRLPARSAWSTEAVQNLATRWATDTSRRNRVLASGSATEPVVKKFDGYLLARRASAEVDDPLAALPEPPDKVDCAQSPRIVRRERLELLPPLPPDNRTMVWGKNATSVTIGM